jgi:hypothetical protein
MTLFEAICMFRKTERRAAGLFEAEEPEIKTFGDLHKHFGADALGPRKMGSTTDHPLTLPHDTPVEEFRPHKDADLPIAKYYRVHKKHVDPALWAKINPRLGAVPYASLSPEEKKAVKVRPGHTHGRAGFGDGRELYVDRDAHSKHMPEADHLTFIMGPVGDKLGPWTWHPGAPLAVHDSDYDHGRASTHGEKSKDPNFVAKPNERSFSGANPTPATAVKVHRG